MINRKFVMFAACAAIVLVFSGLKAQAQQLYDPNEPGSVLVFPKIVRGTTSTPAGGIVPATEIEITAHCPLDQQPCSSGTSVNMVGHWVCPGDSSYICHENNFTFKTTDDGTVNFSTEGSPVGTLFTTVKVPAPPCPEGFLVVWAANTKSQPIAFNGLVGDAVIRWNGHAAGSYNAIAIQSVGLPSGSLITGTTNHLPFDGLTGHYASLAGTAMATIKYDEPTPTPVTDAPSQTSLVLLTLDVLSNRPNDDVFADMDFFDANENVLSEFTDFTCWEEVPLESIDGSLIRDFMTRKGFFYTLDANKVAEYGITDTAGPVTLLGLIDTVECQGSGSACTTTVPVVAGNNAAIMNHYMYKDDDDSIPVATTYVGP